MRFECLPDKVYVMHICCTEKNSFLLSTSGRVFSWGDNGPVLGRNIYKDG